MRGKARNYKKNQIEPDPKYNSTQVAKFINQLMRRGKKSTAQKIVYAAFAICEVKLKKPAVDIFETAISNSCPQLEVRSRRIGGATYQVPMEVKRDRQQTLAMRWIIQAARDRQGSQMADYLAQELMDAAQNIGAAVKKKQEMHKLAEVNRAFAHYARL
ncbi:MAG TPA: 30S ribosomal protein S7 [Patescibacteria group bacterium]|nr:30S ribosomal protein S7 [Patescibacteria group bacterium]